MSGPMHPAIERLERLAEQRRAHFSELARTAGTPGRRSTAAQQAAYYTRVSTALRAAVRAAEHSS